MNKKGFTLIELLAVIVILAIIALITTPIVLNLINQSKEAANKRSVEAYAKAVEYAVAQYEYEHNGELPTFDDIKNNIEYSNSDVKCHVAINCDTKGSVELTGCQVGSYTNNYYKYSSLKGNKGATVDEGVTEGPGNSSVEAVCSGGSSSSGNYVYATMGNGENEDGVITEANQGSTSRPDNYHAYFKYALDGDELVTPPEACIYKEEYGGELCLVHDDFENSTSKIKTYFKWDDANNESEYGDSVECYFSGGDSSCYDESVEVYANSSGIVYASDYASSFRCDVADSYEFNCIWD